MAESKVFAMLAGLCILFAAAVPSPSPALASPGASTVENGDPETAAPKGLLAPAAAASARKAAAAGDFDSVNDILRKGGARWTSGKTRFTGMPTERKKQFLGLRNRLAAGLPQTPARSASTGSPDRLLPASFDWRNNGGDWVTRVKDQGPCGSCWAFAAAGQFESILRIYSGSPDTPANLSEQFMVSCCNLNWGCYGGATATTFDFMLEDGVPPERCFPYVADDVSCSNACAYADDISFLINDYWWITEGSIDIEDIKDGLAAQPLYATFLVYEDFMDYVGGVYQYSYGELLAGHAVLITGWEDAESCWIVKNSWGEGYGESGYFRIAFSNGCGFGEETIGVLYQRGVQPLFIAEPGSGHAPLEARFFDASIASASDPIVSREWSFSNGETATGSHPVVTFDDPGEYGAVLTVTTDGGSVDSLHLEGIITVTAEESSVLHVPGDFSSIGAAVAAAVDGDTILATAGTYTGSSNRNIDPAGKSLVITGESGPDSCIIEGSFSGRAFYIHNGEDANVVIEGFTIRNFKIAKGAGIFVSGSSPTLKNLRFDTCSAGSYFGGDGGGLLLLDSESALENIEITNCSADDYGGGMYISSSYPVIGNLTVTSTSAGAGGGLFLKNGSRVVISGVDLSGNSTTGDGGGFYASRNSILVVEDGLFRNNSAGEGGGAGCLQSGSSYEFTRCEITGNSAYEGGAVYMRAARRPTAVQVVFSENRATRLGGALFCELGSSPLFADCIIWDNQDGIVFSSLRDPDTTAIAYSCVEGGEAGVILNGNGTLFWLDGNIDEDPQLRSPWTGDFSLAGGSPCIDAGIHDTFFEYSPGDTLKVPILPFIGAAPDMGAYEYNPSGAEDNPAPGGGPVQLTLKNKPNPFNPVTTVVYILPAAGKTRLGVYDMRGRLVKILADGHGEKGRHAVTWNGSTDSGGKAASGVYIYRLESTGGTVSKRMVLLQ